MPAGVLRRAPLVYSPLANRAPGVSLAPYKRQTNQTYYQNLEIDKGATGATSQRKALPWEPYRPRPMTQIIKMVLDSRKGQLWTLLKSGRMRSWKKANIC